MITITTPDGPDIDHFMNDLISTCNTPEVAVIVTTEQQLASASARPSGVLSELALACWRGSATEVSLPPRREDD